MKLIFCKESLASILHFKLSFSAALSATSLNLLPFNLLIYLLYLFNPVFPRIFVTTAGAAAQ